MMKKKTTKTGAEKQEFMDVSQPEKQHIVQCEDVRLIASLFRPLIEKDERPESSGFSFNIHVFVGKEQTIGHLDTKVIYLTDEEETGFKGYYLQFDFMAKFVANQQIDAKEMSDFASMYTLSILWPYAREYASDLLRRAGGKFESLPIINPQVVTEQLIKDKLVKVTLEDEPSDQPAAT